MSERKIWNRDRTYALLRYGRKQSGPWDCDPAESAEWNEADIPDDGDLELVLAAPEMFELLETIENDDGSVPPWLWERIQEVVRKVKGDQ